MSIGLQANGPTRALSETAKDSPVLSMHRALLGQLNRVDESLAELQYRLLSVLSPDQVMGPALSEVKDVPPTVRIVDMLGSAVARVEAQADRLRQILSRLDV